MDPNDLLGFLCGFACVLGFITVVGHGIWLVLAYIFRQINGGEVVPPPSGKPCPYCRHPQGVIAGRCIACGRIPQVNPGAALEQDLEATARHLKRLLDRKIIPQEQFDSLMQVLSGDMARLRGNLGAPPLAASVAALPAGSPGETSRPQSDRGFVPPKPPVVAEIVETEVAGEGINWVERPKAASRTLEPAATNTAHPHVPAPAAKMRPDANASILAAPPQPPKSPPAPVEPARPLADVLQNFMQESNIRFGEIIAGLLIVGSAVGLIISLRNTLKAIPYSSAILFMLFTVGFYGAGMYTLRRWKLHAISRVILIISLLLVPLSVAAAIVMSGSGDMQRATTDPLFIAAVLVGTIVYSLVTYSTSQEVVGEGKWRLTVAMMGASLSQIVINRIAPAASTLTHISLLAALPIGSFLVAAIGQVIRGRSWRRISSL
ncbi:MAG: hypothetical protein K8R36_15990, partial [Planctomycetales bacterium]|nr:hypothetical protein [Planctomycetales bacterium]